MEREEVVPGLALEFIPETDVAVFTVTGTVRLRDVGRALDLGLQVLSGRARHLVLDFSEATQFLNIGPGLLAWAQAHLGKRGRKMAIVLPADESVLESLPVDLRKVFTAYDTREEAIEALLKGE